MTDPGNASLLGSLLLVGMMGLRHGFDADHLAVVDGMTRARQVRGFWTSRLVGAQFALGHGAVILFASLLLHRQSVALPPWLDGLGMVISACFLLAIAVSNIQHAVRAPSQRPQPCSPVVAALMRVSGGQLHPVLVGMAFALSFDALAQAAFFASRGNELASLGTVALLAATFGAGMLIADAANGALLAWFASRSDHLARHASRFSSGFIALLALMTLAAGMMRELHAGFAIAWEEAGVWIGIGLVILTSSVYSVRILLQRRAHAAAVAR